MKKLQTSLMSFVTDILIDILPHHELCQLKHSLEQKILNINNTKPNKFKFILYCQKEHDNIKNLHKDWTDKKINKHLRDYWKNLSPEVQNSFCKQNPE